MAAEHSLLRELRIQQGLTLKQVSGKAGISFSHLGLLEREPARKPAPDLLARLVDALGVSEAERNDLFDYYGLDDRQDRGLLLIDGSWLRAVGVPCLQRLTRQERFLLDLSAVPSAVSERLQGVSIKRSVLVTSTPAGLSEEDATYYEAKHSWFNRMALRSQERSEIDVINPTIDFKAGRFRLRREDRTEDQAIRNPVPLAVASEAVKASSHQPPVDVVVLLAGDPDYRILLEAIRETGRRTALVTARTSADPALYSGSPTRVLDWEPLWLDEPDFVADISQKASPDLQWLECTSALHDGDRKVQGTPFPQSQYFACAGCQRLLEAALENDEPDERLKSLISTLEAVERREPSLCGRVSSLGHKGFGFITVQGHSFYFDQRALCKDVFLRDLTAATVVKFDVLTWPTPDGRNGRAANVTPVGLESVALQTAQANLDLD
mgnify:CR=1 FL=1